LPEIVLVHGLWYGAGSMALLGRRLESAGYHVRRFRYPARKQDPQSSAARLAEFCRRGGADKTHLLGHSLGGLLILLMLQYEHDFARELPAGRLVLLGSPLAGSQVARRISKIPGSQFLLGRSSPLLGTGLEGIPGNAWGERACGMIAGTLALGIGRLSGALDGPSDGTVCTRETRSELLADRLEIPATHTGLLFSAEVARQAAIFLSTGQFEHLGRAI